MKRHEAREKALQALFQIDVGRIPPEEALQNVMGGEEADSFLRQLVFGVTEHQEEIDELLRANLEKWTLERVANVDRAILRMAAYEMKYLDDVPVKVSLDEAVELAKKFGDTKSGRFVNGVLSKVKDALHIQE
ncbi:transcription antitermination factor NusB [Parageobacillus thermoglucosidasius]|uniref:Transcription antitermination protein NusB n=3 Tax=Anoxybacillaceae TaxID=3120669 RepID=A0AB38R5J7_PARTM|nr:transcription antitermination factor NusB [Parageobacillus thermoglucosidasius]REK55561.1 MAG: transcription antitermination factor NusB [Geobacillus sp.]AEH47275.1 NusB antitermination factor [Parageobacillus thermoglucosidasius C56-YS93]ALF11476.1 antitermination protein NusB [Parageobacillus thermoglucosidasius]ANZ31555.1 N utilization substance protein B [Parageobacillus thermoglucosidasius]APM82293.1 N utilization substance protein B [Parageobacillus thermoglucosidasius]